MRGTQLAIPGLPEPAPTLPGVDVYARKLTAAVSRTFRRRP